MTDTPNHIGTPYERDVAGEGIAGFEWERVCGQLATDHIGHGLQTAFWTDEQHTGRIYNCECGHAITLDAADVATVGI